MNLLKTWRNFFFLLFWERKVKEWFLGEHYYSEQNGNIKIVQNFSAKKKFYSSMNYHHNNDVINTEWAGLVIQNYSIFKYSNFRVFFFRYSRVPGYSNCKKNTNENQKMCVQCNKKSCFCNGWLFSLFRCFFILN